VEKIGQCATEAGLEITESYAFGSHYAQTLRVWRERAAAAAEQIETLGFDTTFRRMWNLYLAYSEAGFASGYLNVNQFVLTKPTGAPK
jgi:cyclopropane-fatty-acyl-phospholipid synthase